MPILSSKWYGIRMSLYATAHVLFQNTKLKVENDYFPYCTCWHTWCFSKRTLKKKKKKEKKNRSATTRCLAIKPLLLFLCVKQKTKKQEQHQTLMPENRPDKTPHIPKMA